MNCNFGYAYLNLLEIDLSFKILQLQFICFQKKLKKQQHIFPKKIVEKNIKCNL